MTAGGVRLVGLGRTDRLGWNVVFEMTFEMMFERFLNLLYNIDGSCLLDYVLLDHVY